MHGDDKPLDVLKAEVERLAEKIGRQESDIGRLWNQLNGLRETLENMNQRHL